MKKIGVASLLMSCFSMAMQATSISESFETGSFSEEWTVRSAEGSKNAVWSVVDYSSLNAKIGNPGNAGEKLAMSLTGGYSTVGGVLPDSWLISPEITVNGTEFLNFYYAYNLTYNSNVNLTADQKAKFAVLVSTSGIDASDFTDELFYDVGEGLASWRNVSVDLSKYDGKTIRIAFRNYNTEIHASASSMITQRLYIDNVEVSKTPAYDVALTGATDFQSGTIKSQPLTLTVRNYGHTVDNFSVSYAVNGGAAVSETVNHALQQGESYSYTFSQPVQFTVPGENTVEVKVSISDDKFEANNALTKTLTIAEQGEIPYELQGAGAETAMVSTLSGSYTNPRGWIYFADDYNTWIYTEAGAPAYLYTAKSFHLSPGTYSADFGYTCTGTTMQLDMYAFQTVGNYGSPIASKALSQSIEEITLSTLIFDIAEEGDYMFAFSVSGANKNEQVTLPSLKISTASTTPDIVVNRIISPNGWVVGGSYKVTAVFTNNSGVDATDVPVSYALGADAGSGVIPSIKAGDSVTYTFDKKVAVSDVVGDYQLSVKASYPLDSNLSNDETLSTVSVYAPLSTPWADSFEDDDATAKWTVENPGNDMTYFGITDEYSWDGDNLMLLNSFNATKQDDWLISPALSITGAARLAFYYGNLANSAASSKVTVYLAQSTDTDLITASGTIVKQFKDKAASINYVSLPITPETAGTYFVAFHVEGGTEAFYIDDVRVDDSSEVYVSQAECGAAEAAYFVDNAEVKVTVVNGSSKALSNITARYTVADGDGVKLTDDVIENIAQIAAGESLEYTFTQSLNITTPGVYTVTVSVAYLFDTDSRNNSIELPTITVLDEKSVPYVATFEETNDDYAISFGDKWERSSLGVYAGSAALNAYSKVADTDKGDWAFLHKLWLEAGTYDFSFFWRTSGGNTGDGYRKSFAIYLGSEPTVDKMSILLFEGKDMLNASELAQKEMSTFTVDADGYYYVGVQNTSATTSGWIAIDDITIDVPATGIAVGYGDAAYTSDIENRADEWYHYHPSSNIRQWSVATDDDGVSYFKATESEDWSGNIQTASFIEAPAFSLVADNAYDITVTYAINPYLSTTVLGTDNSLELFASTIDNPSDFARIASFSKLQEKATETVKYTAATSGLHYFSFRPSSADETVYSLYSLRVANADNTAVNNIAVAAEVEPEYFTISGVRIPRPTAPGIYIRRLGSATTKLILK